MTKYTKEITDDDIVEAIHNLIADSDCDDLAWFNNELFGICTEPLGKDNEDGRPLFRITYDDRTEGYMGAFGFGDSDDSKETGQEVLATYCGV